MADIEHHGDGCGSTSWKVINRKAINRSSSTAETGEERKRQSVDPAAYITPHPQHGPVATPTAPRAHRSTLKFQPSPATRKSLKTMVPSPPLAPKSLSRVVKEEFNDKPQITQSRTESTERLQAQEPSRNKGGSSIKDSDVEPASTAQKELLLDSDPIKMSESHLGSVSRKGLGWIRLEDELLDAATSDVASINISEVKEHHQQGTSDGGRKTSQD